MLRITSKAIIEELRRRSIPVETVDEVHGLLRYRQHGEWRLFKSSVSPLTSRLGGYVADRKDLAQQVLAGSGFTIPQTVTYTTAMAAEAFLAQHRRLVVKPRDGAHGNGVTINVETTSALQAAVETARRYDSRDGALLQEQVAGIDLRILIIDGAYAAAALRVPAEVVGDGVSSMRALIETENRTNPQRGLNYEKPLNVIDLEAAQRYLGAAIDTLVPAHGEVVRVGGPANIGMGGKAVDVTDDIPRAVIEQCEAISRQLQLPVCGVDFIVADVAQIDGYRFIEVNASPSFGLHLHPAEGAPRPVARLFVDHLLKEAH